MACQCNKRLGHLATWFLLYMTDFKVQSWSQAISDRLKVVSLYMLLDIFELILSVDCA